MSYDITIAMTLVGGPGGAAADIVYCQSSTTTLFQILEMKAHCILSKTELLSC